MFKNKSKRKIDLLITASMKTNENFSDRKMMKQFGNSPFLR